MVSNPRFAKRWLAVALGRETRERCQGVPITAQRDKRVEIVGEVPDMERGDLP